MRRFLTPRWLIAGALVVLVAIGGLLLLAPAGDTFIFLPDEAHAVAPLVEVEGGSTPDDGGGIYYTDVLVRRASWLERLFPSIREGSSLVPAEALNPTGVSDEARRQGNLREMSRSQEIAAAVALEELGYDVDATPRGALVESVFPGTPAAGKLQPTDVVVAVDGKRVRTPGDLRRLVSAHTPGDEVVLDVRRGDELVKVTLATVADPGAPERAIIGVAADQDAEIELPLDVRIDAGDVGGPSAGLAFALGLLEQLGRDVDGGRRVAVTGELELDGDVAPVGGLRQKTIGARRSGVDAFVVPAGDNAEEARRHAGDLPIIPVRNFQQALRALATLPDKPSADGDSPARKAP